LRGGGSRKRGRSNVVRSVVLTLADVDQLLEAASTLDSSTPAARLRGGRDDLVHAAVLLSYARHVLSVDIGALQAIADAPAPDLQTLIDDLPHVLETASIGGGWSLSPDAPATAASARQALEGAANGLMTSHDELARIDFGSPEAVGDTLHELEVELALVAERRERVEMRVREIQALLVEQYKRGEADADDWLQ
jgi:hypothetical protein